VPTATKKSAAKPAAAKKTSAAKGDAAKSAATQKREQLRDLCRRATAIMTSDLTIAAKSAPVSIPQMSCVLDFIGGRNVLKFVATTEKQLRAYAAHDITISQLPAATREALVATGNVEPYSRKSWPLKSASMLLAIHESRSKSSSRKPATKSRKRSS
jgi:hypothetical protein